MNKRNLINIWYNTREDLTVKCNNIVEERKGEIKLINWEDVYKLDEEFKEILKEKSKELNENCKFMEENEDEISTKKKKSNKKKDKNICDNILRNMKNVKLIEKDEWNDNNNLRDSLINDDNEGMKEDESEMETIMDFRDERDKFLKKWIRIFNLVIKDYEIVDKEGKMFNGVDTKKIIKAIFEVKEKMEKMDVVKNNIKNKKLLKWYDQRKII